MDNDYDQFVEDIRLERAFAGFQKRMNDITVRVAHCHVCGHMDSTDPYRVLCDLGHIMQPCLITKYRLLTKMAAYN